MSSTQLCVQQVKTTRPENNDYYCGHYSFKVIMKYLKSKIALNPNFSITLCKGSLYCRNNRGTTIVLNEEDQIKFEIIKNLRECPPEKTRTVRQLLDNLFPDTVNQELLSKCIFDLLHLEILTLEPQGIGISREERRRYHRQLAFFNKYQTEELDIYDIQNSLRNSKLAIIGLGGQGSIVATYLASIGVGNLTIIDGDRIEESNLARQVFYTHSDIGKFKAEVLKEHILKQNPYVAVKSVNSYINSLSDIKSKVGAVDFVVLCGDEPMVSLREWVNNYCVINEIPNIGVSGNWVGPICIPGKTACFECEKSFYKKKYKDYKSTMNWWINHSRQSKHRPAFAFNPSASGLFIAQQTAKFLTKVMPVETLTGHWAIDSTLNTFFETIPRNKKCKSCKVKHVQN